MDIELTPPADDLMQCFGALEATLAADAGGDKARRLAGWLGEAEMQARERRLRCTDFDDRRVADVTADALAASRRVLIAAWNKKHGRELSL